MVFAQGHTQEEALTWFSDHVSSGKAAFFAQYGMEFVPGRRASGFQQLMARYPETLVETRQLGLMIGLVLPDETCGPLMTKLLYNEGVLAIYANNDQRVLQFLPPLIMDDLEAEEALAALDRALATLSMLRDCPIRH